LAAQSFSLETIEDFLAQKRNAMVGISRKPRSLSVLLADELFPPHLRHRSGKSRTPNVQGRHGFARLQNIQPPVDPALLMSSPAVTDTVVCDCSAAGIHRV
jgi:hypothetical protein